MHDPIPPRPATPDQDDTYYRDLLQNLIARGADLAVRVHESTIPAQTTPELPSETQEATPQASPASAQAASAQAASAQAASAKAALAQAALAYDRILRAVRRTIALARHIANNPIGAQSASKNHRTRNSPARTRLARAVQEAAQRPGSNSDTLFTHIIERLDDEDLIYGIDGRPLDEVIDEICDELGIPRPTDAAQDRTDTPRIPAFRRPYAWKQRTPRDLPVPSHRNTPAFLRKQAA